MCIFLGGMREFGCMGLNYRLSVLKLTYLIQIICNVFFSNSIIPNKWRTTLIKSILNILSVTDPLQYSDISVLPNLYKIYSSK